MTETAKQNTTKEPAEPAATRASDTRASDTRAAATQGEARAETAAPDETAGGQTAPAADDAAPDLDETKRKFREALERKHQAHTDGQGKGGRDGGKISGAHGPAASRRNFRRKSG
jgi:hypothetical protein